jgi:hypothetical protein
VLGGHDGGDGEGVARDAGGEQGRATATTPSPRPARKAERRSRRTSTASGAATTAQGRRRPGDARVPGTFPVVSWEGPGFVDHHTHLLRVSVGAAAPCDVTDPDDVAAYHHAILGRWSTPMDEEHEPLGRRRPVRGRSSGGSTGRRPSGSSR